MMIQRRFLVAGICAAAMLLTVNAQEKKTSSLIADVLNQPDVKFANLVRVLNIQGVCEVNNPDVGSFKPVSHNKAYPLGSTFRTGAGSTCFLVISEEDHLEIMENSEVIMTGLCEDGKTCQTMTAKIISGTIKTSLRDNLKGCIFNVNTPNVDVKEMTGRGEYTLSSDVENEIFRAATITGTGSITGAHYSIPALQAANTVDITTSTNRSFTTLTSISGDFPIILPNGTEEPVNFDMSPKAIVKIWRKNAPVGGRTIISTLVVSPSGMARHRFAYAEGRDFLKTGELAAIEEAEDVPEIELLSDKKNENADANKPDL